MEKIAPVLGPFDLFKALERGIRDALGPATAEPLPGVFLNLLEQLDRAERERSSTTLEGSDIGHPEPDGDNGPTSPE